MELTINKKKIHLKYTLRSMMMYENIADKSFAPETLTDILTFFYCCVVASSGDYSLGFDEFITYIDEHQEKVNEFADWLNATITNTETLKKK